MTEALTCSHGEGEKASRSTERGSIEFAGAVQSTICCSKSISLYIVSLPHVQRYYIRVYT